LGTWSFDAPESQWQHDVLAELVEDLEDFEAGLRAEDAIPAGRGWSIPKRLAFARELEAGFAQGGDYRAAWDAALPSIHEAYPGLDLEPQMGLVPIGADPRSGLWEFAHLMSGELPLRRPDGELILTEATGVVLVLLPGGPTWRGAQAADPGGRNYDAQAMIDEGPVHEVELSPFFLSKYELNQAQWMRIAGVNPSIYKPPRLAASLLHPVEQVSWLDCMQWLSRAGLFLPSDAQWEYGARAGTETAWWTGSDRESLRELHAANLADQSAGRTGVPWTGIADWPELDDGFPAHAPMGTFAANDFGLHEVIGNVWEWALDGYVVDIYRRSPRVDPVVPWETAEAHSTRGGGFQDSARFCRSAARLTGTPSFADVALGLRPARSLDPR